MEVGEKTGTVLYKLTTDQQKMALKGMKHFYLDNQTIAIPYYMAVGKRS